MRVEDDDGVAGGGLGPGEARPDQAELPRLDVQLDVRRETVLDVERQRVRYIWSGKYTASRASKIIKFPAQTYPLLAASCLPLAIRHLSRSLLLSGRKKESPHRKHNSNLQLAEQMRAHEV